MVKAAICFLEEKKTTSSILILICLCMPSLYHALPVCAFLPFLVGGWIVNLLEGRLSFGYIHWAFSFCICEEAAGTCLHAFYVCIMEENKGRKDWENFAMPLPVYRIFPHTCHASHHMAGTGWKEPLATKALLPDIKNRQARQQASPHSTLPTQHPFPTPSPLPAPFGWVGGWWACLPLHTEQAGSGTKRKHHTMGEAPRQGRKRKELSHMLRMPPAAYT